MIEQFPTLQPINETNAHQLQLLASVPSQLVGDGYVVFWPDSAKLAVAGNFSGDKIMLYHLRPLPKLEILDKSGGYSFIKLKRIEQLSLLYDLFQDDITFGTGRSNDGTTVSFQANGRLVMTIKDIDRMPVQWGQGNAQLFKNQL